MKKLRIRIIFRKDGFLAQLVSKKWSYSDKNPVIYGYRLVYDKDDHKILYLAHNSMTTSALFSK